VPLPRSPAAPCCQASCSCPPSWRRLRLRDAPGARVHRRDGHGARIRARQLEALAGGGRAQQSILDAIARPAEKTKPWYEYREIFLTERREREGIEFLREHRNTLSRAQAETGVPAELIVAIIGVETYYGRIAGSYDVIDALSTLAFDYPKRSQLLHRRAQKLPAARPRAGPRPPDASKGSYAGAMGYGQFMPSSYRAYAVDFDGDGLADIWNNPVDAIGSVANYLARHGWQAGEPVVSRATASTESPRRSCLPAGSSRSAGRGARRRGPEGGAAPRPERALAPLRFELEDGHEYWLGLHNFYVDHALQPQCHVRDERVPAQPAHRLGVRRVRRCAASPLVPAALVAALLGPVPGPTRRSPGRETAHPAALKPAEVADAVPRPDPILAPGIPRPTDRRRRIPRSRVGSRLPGRGHRQLVRHQVSRQPDRQRRGLRPVPATAAHRSLPIPSYVRVTNLDNNRQMVVRVNDRGPFHPDRLIDLSYAAAVKLGFVDRARRRCGSRPGDRRAG
jgi:membrane-bound lytic murein transglycosylase B